MRLSIDRRGLLAGLGACALPLPAAAADLAAWRAYEARLRARIADAGGGRFDEDYAQGLLIENNRFRESRKIAPLQEDAELTLTARAQAGDMAARNFFAHNAPEGFEPNDRAGLLVRRMVGGFGENLALQQTTGQPFLPRSTFEGWRDSPGHRRNMLDARYTHVGHATVRIGRKWLSVAVFGEGELRLGRPLPLRADAQAIAAALASAQPQVERYMLSEPEGAPIEPPRLTAGRALEIGPGVWRLRPMLNTAPRRYSVLWGPIFFV